jgi:hypothetical protein
MGEVARSANKSDHSERAVILRSEKWSELLRSDELGRIRRVHMPCLSLQQCSLVACLHLHFRQVNLSTMLRLHITVHLHACARFQSSVIVECCPPKA